MVKDEECLRALLEVLVVSLKTVDGTRDSAKNYLKKLKDPDYRAAQSTLFRQMAKGESLNAKANIK